MRYKFTLLIAFFLLLNGCMTQTPIKTVPEVNLKSFMGPWFVIAHIPTFIEKNAFNAIESYELNKTVRSAQPSLLMRDLYQDLLKHIILKVL